MARTNHCQALRKGGAEKVSSPLYIPTYVTCHRGTFRDRDICFCVTLPSNEKTGSQRASGERKRKKTNCWNKIHKCSRNRIFLMTIWNKNGFLHMQDFFIVKTTPTKNLVFEVPVVGEISASRFSLGKF